MQAKDGNTTEVCGENEVVDLVASGGGSACIRNRRNANLFREVLLIV